MKESVTGYLTGMINNHQRIVDSLIKFHYPETKINEHKNHVNELRDLLDFVEDIPEENTEVLQLKNKVRDYEDSIKSMTIVEKNLHKKISELTFTNRLLTMLGGKANG